LPKRAIFCGRKRLSAPNANAAGLVALRLLKAAVEGDEGAAGGFSGGAAPFLSFISVILITTLTIFLLFLYILNYILFPPFSLEFLQLQMSLDKFDTVKFLCPLSSLTPR